MTGGGFGGSIVALVKTGRAAALRDAVAAAYRVQTGREGRGWICATVDGAARR